MINVKQIQKHLIEQDFVSEISLTTIRKVLKDYIKARYKLAEKVSKKKNEEDVKVYRRYIVEMLFHYFSENQLIISVDETGFS